MQLYIVILSTAVLNSCVKLVSTQSVGFTELCTSYVPKDYKSYEIPKKEGPVKIYNKIEVLDVGEINEENMDFLFHVFFTIFWTDSRVKINESIENTFPVLLPKECLPYFWQPAIFFETAKTVEYFKNSAPAILLKVFSDGIVSITKRYQFRCSCRMQFHYYPFDSQICEFYVSLIPPDSEAILHWSDEKYHLENMPDVTLLRPIEPLQYSLGKIQQRKIVDSLPEANYTSLVSDLFLHRRLIGSVINTYLPSTLIVLMSLVGFWLGVDAVPARVALSITSLLTLCTQVRQYQSQLPPVNYIKAMDIWLFVCIFLVFSTLLEFAMAYNLNQKHKKRGSNENGQAIVLSGSDDPHSVPDFHVTEDDIGPTPNINSSDTSENNLDDSEQTSKVWTLCKQLWLKWKSQSLDEFCQTLYPTGFVIFACCYWTHYLNIYYSLRHV